MRTKVLTRFSAAFCIWILRPLTIARIVFFSLLSATQVCHGRWDSVNDGVAHFPFGSDVFNSGLSFR